MAGNMKKKYFKPETTIVHIDSQITLLAGSAIQGDIDELDILVPTESTPESIIQNELGIW